MEKQEECFRVHHIAVDIQMRIYKKGQRKKKEVVEHQYHRNTVIVKKGTTTSSLLLWLRQTDEDIESTQIINDRS